MFVVIMKHNSSASGNVAVKPTIEEALEVSHRFFLSYDFQVINGKPWDGGNSRVRENPAPDDEGFDAFDNVQMLGDKVLTFMHCGGDGPVCEIKKAD
jgi:hypothetical protein